MKTMCGGLFSFCFPHETVFGNGQVAITHNMKVYAAGKSKWSKFWAIKFPKKSNAFSKSLHAKQAKSKLLSNYLFQCRLRQQ